MRKSVRILFAILACIAVAAPAMAVEFTFHGDLNNRFSLYSSHANLYKGAVLEKGVAEQGGATGAVLGKENNTTWGDAKYRMWTEAKSNDGKVKGVVALEVGAIHYGDSDKGGAYSGDGKTFETRWLYTQFQTPGIDGKSLVTLGLQPYKVNKFVWSETAMGVKYTTDVYELAWMRGYENFNKTSGADNSSADAFSARANLKPAENVKLGLFGLYQTQKPDTAAAGKVDAAKYGIKQMTDVEYNIYTLGVDGGLTSGNLFVNWDGIYQGGKFKKTEFTGFNGTRTGDFDLSAFLLHADVGLKLGAGKLTYTTWYVSGDDNDTDNKLKAFMSTDVDIFDSVVLFEGGYTDDNYMTERPYLFNNGMFFNKLAYDRQQTKKFKWGVAVLYMQTAEKLNNENVVGTEFDTYVSYKLYDNVELALNGGYLATGNWWNTVKTADADEDIYRVTSRLRYKF